MNNYKNKYLKYKNKYINLKGGNPNKLDMHFYAHVLLEEESSPFIGNSIENVIDHLKNILEKYDSKIYNYIINQIILNYILPENKYDLSNLVINTAYNNYIIPVTSNMHAISLIIDNKNKLIIITNTGYKIGKYHVNNFCFKIYGNKCYYNLINLIKHKIKILINCNNEDEINLNSLDDIYIFLFLLDNISEYSIKNIQNFLNIDKNSYNNITSILTYIRENECYKNDIKNNNSEIQLLQSKLIHSKVQNSGSCTYLSLLMSLYYTIYNDNNTYNEIFITLENYIKQYVLSLIDKIDIKYYDDYLIKFLKIINRKYNNRYICTIENFYANDKKKLYPLNNDIYLYFREKKERQHNIRKVKILPFDFNTDFNDDNLIEVVKNKLEKKYTKYEKIILDNDNDVFYNNILLYKKDNNSILVFLIFILSKIIYSDRGDTIDENIYYIKFFNDLINYLIDFEYILLSIIIIYIIILKTYENKTNIFDTYLIIIFFNILKINNIINIDLVNRINIKNIELYTNEIYVYDYFQKKELFDLFKLYYNILPIRNKNWQDSLYNCLDPKFKVLFYYLVSIITFIFKIEYQYILSPCILSSDFFEDSTKIEDYVMIVEDTIRIIEETQEEYIFIKNTIYKNSDIEKYKVAKKFVNLKDIYKDKESNNIKFYKKISNDEKSFMTNSKYNNIYNYAKLLYENNNIIIDYKQILLSNGPELFKYPTKIKEDDYIIINNLNYLYTDTKNSFYTFERDDFIYYFLKINFSEEKISQFNPSILLMIYLQTIYYNIINDNILKIKNFLDTYNEDEYNFFLNKEVNIEPMYKRNSKYSYNSKLMTMYDFYLCKINNLNKFEKSFFNQFMLEFNLLI